jgi:hypothetical protein
MLMDINTLMDRQESGIYTGTVFHKRSVPKVHKFDYRIYLFWIKLKEVDTLSQNVSGFTVNKSGFSVVNFLRSDYLGESSLDLETCILDKMNSLSEQVLSGDIYMLGQIRTFGLYFSPVNFFYLRSSSGEYTHMLAEVSNTPWNKRHYYLVDLSEQKDCEKAFHVSPFNPMDMEYKWQIQQPSDTLKLRLSCFKETLHFEAAINMQKKPLTSATLRSSILSIPSMTLKTVVGIYWQALKLFFKRVPIYTHP